MVATDLREPVVDLVAAVAIDHSHEVQDARDGAAGIAGMTFLDQAAQPLLDLGRRGVCRAPDPPRGDGHQMGLHAVDPSTRASASTGPGEPAG